MKNIGLVGLVLSTGLVGCAHWELDGSTVPSCNTPEQTVIYGTEITIVQQNNYIIYFGADSNKRLANTATVTFPYYIDINGIIIHKSQGEDPNTVPYSIIATLEEDCSHTPVSSLCSYVTTVPIIPIYEEAIKYEPRTSAGQFQLRIDLSVESSCYQSTETSTTTITRLRTLSENGGVQ